MGVLKKILSFKEKKSLKKDRQRLILGITAGRSGMAWLASIFDAHQNALGWSERYPDAEAFYRYIKGNNLPIDTQGIIELIRGGIREDWQEAEISFLSSPYFSPGFLDIFYQLKADRVIWGINDPRLTATSFYNKGWYAHKDIRGDRDLVSGFQVAGQKWHHFFGRLIPVGKFYDEWRFLTRIGKIAWFLNTLNLEIYAHIKKLPREKVWIFKLEEAAQNYDYYLQLAQEFGLEPLLSEKKFLAFKTKKVVKGKRSYRVWSEWENVPKVWTRKEEREFQKYAADYIKIYPKLWSGKYAVKS